MRLLRLGREHELSLTENLINDIPPYAVLSHTWGADADEVTFEDFQNGTGHNKSGYTKIVFCGEQARRDGIKYFWVDTCCINKANHSEMSEAIISMYRWYRYSIKCYVYLSDVAADQRDLVGTDACPEWMSGFRKSRWFTRGWTLQELLAPETVEFFSKERMYLGNKINLVEEIHQITGIPTAVLQGADLNQYPIAERRRWAFDRRTTREEDEVYCLLGICKVVMLPMYGERKEHALRRLEKEIRDKDDTPGIRIGAIPEDALAILSRVTGDKHISEMWYNRVAQRFHRYNYRRVLQRIMELRHPETGSWLLSHETYQAWITSTRSSILWVVGSAGTGKTILSTTVIGPQAQTGMEAQLSDEIRLFSHFQTKFNDTCTSVLCTLIHQLLEAHPELRQRADAFSTSVNSGPQLLTLFKELINCLRKKCIVVLDGLDLTNLPSRISLIGGLLLSMSGIKILIATRDMDALRTTQGIVHMRPQVQEHVLDLQKDSTNSLRQDRSELVQHRLSNDAELSKLSQSGKVRIKNRLRLMNNFLCCKLVLDRLRLGYEHAAFRVSSDILPIDLNALYAFLAGELGKRRSANCVKLLRYLLYARGALHVDELKYGFAQDSKDVNNHGEFIESIKECYPLIVLDPLTHRVELTHFSAGEFLRKYLSEQRSSHPLHLSIAEAEQDMATDCVFRLTLVPLSIIPTPGTDSFDRYASRIDPVLQSQPLLRYALRNWYWHLQRAMDTITSIDDAPKPLLKAVSGLSKMWQDPSAQQLRCLMVKLGEVDHLDPLIELRQFAFFCALGLTPFVEAQLLKHVNSDNLTQRFELALRLAIAGGHSALAQMLISRGAITTLDAPAYEGLLVKLIEKKQYDMMEVLLRMRHSSMQEIKEANAAIFKAGDEKAFNILRDSKAFEPLSGSGATILHTEVARLIKHESYPPADTTLKARIKVLVQLEGIDVNAQESTLGNRLGGDRTILATMGNTALHIACINKQPPDVVRALIEVGADVKIPNHFGWTALHIASLYSDDPLTIDYLLYAGGNKSVAYLTRGGNSVLHWAVMGSGKWYYDAQVPIIKKLLQAGANPKLTNSAGQSALDVAQWTNHGVEVLQQVYTGFDTIGSRRMVAPLDWYEDDDEMKIKDEDTYSDIDVDYDRKLMEVGHAARSVTSDTELTLASETFYTANSVADAAIPSPSASCAPVEVRKGKRRADTPASSPTESLSFRRQRSWKWRD